MATTRMSCQFPDCDYVAEHASEGVAIALFNSHNNGHQQRPSAKQKVPRIDRPMLKQDISDEEWYSFKADWTRFKRCTDIPEGDIADQLFQCCEQSLARLLLKENPDVVSGGEAALMTAIKKMAVLHIATSVRRTNILATKQVHGQSFREFYANVRAAAATCEYSIKCSHACCATLPAVDYTAMVVKDILIAGVADADIRKDVLSITDLDSKTDKEIVQFVEEKEIALNAVGGSLSTAGISTYNRTKNTTEVDSVLKKKLSMKGKCKACASEINLYKMYRASGKTNKDPFDKCVTCFKGSKHRDSSGSKGASTENSAIASFIGVIDSIDSQHNDTDSPPLKTECHPADTEDDAMGNSTMTILNDTEVNASTEVTISIRQNAHKKFGRIFNISASSVKQLVTPNIDSAEMCMMGEDVLAKLGFSKSYLIDPNYRKNRGSSSTQIPGKIGSALIRIEYGSLISDQVVLVSENVSGFHPSTKVSNELHLEAKRLRDADTIDVEGADRMVVGTSDQCGNETSYLLNRAKSPLVLEHHIFTPAGWERASSLSHPCLRVRLTTNADDYKQLGVPQPVIAPKHIDVIADSGAQSSLWSRKEFLSSGFSMHDLIPVRHMMKAANRAPITIDGAVLLRLSGKTTAGEYVEAAVMVYISPEARSFFLSKEAMVQLGVIPENFPEIGSARLNTANVSVTEAAGLGTTQESQPLPDTADCGCLRRTQPPGKPDKLPFACTAENQEKMKLWLLNHYASSTFNRCPHQVLPKMEGPPIKLHVDADAKPVNLRTPAPVPLHWQEKVKQDLDRDVALGVLERVPYGEPTKWCFRMVITRKHDGNPRRTVDLSPLNRYCEREAHPSKSPFHLARSVPQGSLKTVLDAWNGYHSVPIREEDRHFTTFTTPYGLYRYKRAPMGYLSSGDGYSRRFDDISAHVLRMVRCVDDSLIHDTDMEDHWWRVINFLEMAGRGGVVLNSDKFQFAQNIVDFAGFRISDSTVEPLPKYIDAIREYPTPENITDIRSWFGLVNQVSHYSQLRDMMEPFRKFLSPRVKFEWNDELDGLFNQSKERIIQAIHEGVQIFDPTKRTALRVDWSKTGIGFWLLQKHCQCVESSPGCCDNGWRITLAGSRFLLKAEQNYAAIEGEALGVAWALEQTRYFTMGCNDLLVVVDHKPLVKILGDRRLDEIDNPRLLRLKQRTLLWRFQIEYQPGKKNDFADAVSRRPNRFSELASVAMQSEEDRIEESTIAEVGRDLDRFFAVTQERVREETIKDASMSLLTKHIKGGFPTERSEMPAEIDEYWESRAQLAVVNHIVMYKDRIVVPPSLRERVLSNLHSAHQGVSSMNSRARACIFWPGITAEIDRTREICRPCHRNAPSQARLPPVEPNIPKVPFEMIVADYFNLKGKQYLIIGDRLSGWTEVVQVRPGSQASGAKGLCQALRQVFVTFGVPDEISSDGGPEFTAEESKDFYRRWGTRHRLSSAYFPQSNGRAEVAVKSTKRLLEDNVGPSGDLNTDDVVCALLQQRNTPDRDCALSPAEVLFGRTLKDSLPRLDKSQMIFDNGQIHEQWHQAWAAKESALKSRLVRNCEKLHIHSKEFEPLREGDSVFIQNQDPATKRSTKWDKQGTVVATGDYDQYLIRTAGTGRLTLRNRRFLRKFQERKQAVTAVPSLQAAPLPREQNASAPSVVPGVQNDTPSMTAQAPDSGSAPITSIVTPSTKYPTISGAAQHSPVGSPTGCESISPTVTRLSTTQPVQYSADLPSYTPDGSSMVCEPIAPTVRRSTREIQPRKLYDASSGTYK